MQFIPVVERVADGPTSDGLVLIGPDNSRAKVAPWSVESVQYGKFLCAIFDEWVRHDIGRVFVQLFEVAVQIWLGAEPSLCVFRETCGTALALEQNGDLYSCDHFVYPENRLGNILQNPLQSLVNSAQQLKFGHDKRDTLPEYCRRCEVRFACNGECPKHRFIRTPDGEYGLNYLCAGYKLFFSHIDPYVKAICEALRAGIPANAVMDWVARQDNQLAFARAHRNDPCPCGSGKKFKKCCGATTIA